MARHTRADIPERKKEDEHVTTLSNAPLDPVPEMGGEMTAAAADAVAALNPPRDLGVAKALVDAEPETLAPEAPAVQWFRVLADQYVMGAAGVRVKLRAGKELSSSQYNVARLKAQGVRLEPIEPGQVTTF